MVWIADPIPPLFIGFTFYRSLFCMLAPLVISTSKRPTDDRTFKLVSISTPSVANCVFCDGMPISAWRRVNKCRTLNMKLFCRRCQLRSHLTLRLHHIWYRHQQKRLCQIRFTSGSPLYNMYVNYVLSSYVLGPHVKEPFKCFQKRYYLLRLLKFEASP